MGRKIIYIFLVITLFPVIVTASRVSPSTTAIKPGDKIIVAKINDKIITYQDFLNFINLFNKKPVNFEEKLKMLNHLIERTLIIEDAKEKGYFERKSMKKNIKKHSFLKKENSYKTTIVLRQYLIENISKKVKVSKKEIDNYLRKHRGVDKIAARDYIALKKEKKLYKRLIDNLKIGKKIVIFKEKLK